MSLHHPWHGVELLSFVRRGTCIAYSVGLEDTKVASGADSGFHSICCTDLKPRLPGGHLLAGEAVELFTAAWVVHWLLEAFVVCLFDTGVAAIAPV